MALPIDTGGTAAVPLGNSGGNFGNKGFQIGGGFSSKAGQMKDSKGQLDSFKRMARDRIDNKKMTVEENNKIEGALKNVQSIRAKEFMKDAMGIMEKRKVFDMFIAKGDQTRKKKIEVMGKAIAQISGNGGKFNIDSFVQKKNVVNTAKGYLNGKKGMVDAIGKKREGYSVRKAEKALGGSLADIAAIKELQRRANQT